MYIITGKQTSAEGQSNLRGSYIHEYLNTDIYNPLMPINTCI